MNNAGRSVVNSTDRPHDYERVMAVNYFRARCAWCWRCCRIGASVSSATSSTSPDAGVQARNPKYSQVCPPCRAGRQFADVVASETLSDHITPHQHPYAAGGHPDDRAVAAGSTLVRDQRRTRGGDGDPRTGKAGAHDTC